MLAVAKMPGVIDEVYLGLALVRAHHVENVECAFNGDALAALPEFLDRFQAPFPIGYNTQIAVMAYLRYSPVDPRPLYAPHMLFLDRAGVIRAEYPGGDAFFVNASAGIRAQLDKMLQAPSTPKK